MEIASDPDIRARGHGKGGPPRHPQNARLRALPEVGERRRTYVAWFEPAHFIVERKRRFFVRRFTGMRWSILTPYGSAHWDGEMLTSGPARTRPMRPRRTPPRSCGGPITRTSSIRRG